MKPVRRVLGGATIATALALGSATAQGQADANRVAAARQVGYEGYRAYVAGEYSTASEKLERAFRLVKAPTLGLWSARALVKTGAWVRASERYLEVTRLPLPNTNRANHQRAKEEATQERTLLLPRIPLLRIEIRGAPASEVELQMDGSKVDPNLVGVARPVDPGEHILTAHWRGVDQTARVFLEEGAEAAESLSFEPSAPPQTETAPKQKPKTKTKARPRKNPTEHLQRQREQPEAGPGALTYVALGVGAAGLLTGSVAGGMALAKQRELDESGFCSGNGCGAQVDAEVRQLNTLRLVSTIGFAAGAAGAGVGLTLLLWKNGEPKQHERLGLRLGPADVALEGNF